MPKIIIIGASSGPGRLLYERVRDTGDQVLGIARSPRGLAPAEQNARFESTDAQDSKALAKLILPEDTLIHCSRPELLTGYLASSPKIKRLIALGSTRIYTRYPDDKQQRLKALEKAIWTSGIDSTLLHPTMIYGAPGLNNIERITRMARISPIIPLPDHGHALIQPIHAADVVNAICAALARSESIGKTITLPGGAPLTYKEFVELCIDASGQRSKVISLAYPLLSIGARISALIPGVPKISSDEVRRLLEDKDFDPRDMIDLLGVTPRNFSEGVNQTQSL